MTKKYDYQLGSASFKKLVKRVDALENITLTKLFKKIEPLEGSLKIQLGTVVISFNPDNQEELALIKKVINHFYEGKQE